ncbi:hypothetical protein HRTV-25_gp2 [Halorubrum tailed virus 25]|uniref:Uncharacterized protein n=1 Tax=Halorubrum tailed virus 25 TaxID=2878006 RepID=A0AAE9BY03_9CAUD|nr:hypothetical protein M1M37_gp002 [Halorubrum tailed virus 25]UBF22583.1 hypothetical protein HRTV-25_gp2 [Halorubrum tailed virus 25]
MGSSTGSRAVGCGAVCLCLLAVLVCSGGFLLWLGRPPSSWVWFDPLRSRADSW